MRLPIKTAAVNQRTADGHAVTVHILGRRVRHDIGTPFERAAVDRRGEGIVDDQRHAVRMGDTGEFLDVEHLHAGIRQRLAEEELRLRPEGCRDGFLRIVGIDESHADAQLLKGDSQQVESAPIDIGGTDDMVAGAADIQAGEQIGCLPRGGQHRTHAAFQVGDLGGYVVVGRVLETGVEIPALLQVEQPAHLVGSLIFEGRALDDRNLSGFPFAGLVARLHAARADALLAHCSLRFCCKDRGKEKTAQESGKIWKIFLYLP